MGFFDFTFQPRKKDVAVRISQLHHLLRASFGNVKKDTSMIFQWLTYFNQKIIEQDSLVSSLKSELALVPKKEDIKRIIDETYAHEDLMNRLNSIEKRISTAAVSPSAPTQDIFTMQKRLEKLEQRKASIKEKLIKKITRNSKDYVKSVIISMIKKYEKIPALQLKEMIVEEQGLCSKSSFYRLLEEIESREDIGVIKQGKEKHYIGKLSKHN